MQRREFLGTVASIGVLLAARPLLASAPPQPAQMGPNGLHIQSWFLKGRPDLGAAVANAQSRGRRFAVLWEQKGCPYCRDLHNINFIRDDIRYFLTGNFDVLQLDLFGEAPVSDLDGMILPAEKLALKHGVAYTPTMQFFSDGAESYKGSEKIMQEVARLPGYLPPDLYLKALRFVHEKAYQRMSFRDYMLGKTG